MVGDAVFVLKDVAKRYGQKKVLDSITFDIHRGEILGLIGASGAGKTTLLHMLVGFISASSGAITFRVHTRKGIQAYNVMENQNLLAVHYGFASQHQSFYEKLTVRENLVYFGRMYGLSDETINKNADQLLQFMSLKSSAHLLSQHLSGGMKRRLDIACALIHNPSILILDEPTADLDPVLRMQIWDVIKYINSKGTTVILSSHHLNDLDALCTRIGIVKDGKMVDLDTPDKLKSKYSSTQDILVETFPGNYDEIIKRLKPDEMTLVRREGTYLMIRTKGAESLIAKLLPILAKQKESLLDLKLIKPNIDDVFVKIYADKKKEARSVAPLDVTKL